MTQRVCIVCQRAELEPTERQTCIRCLGRTRRSLIQVEEWYALLSVMVWARAGAATPPDPTGIHGDNDPIPGGDAMVLLGPGSTGWHSEQVEVDSVVGVLERWERDWRITFGHGAASGQATVSGCGLYLLRNLGRAAADHPAFDEFASDVRLMFNQLGSMLRAGPQRSPVPCLTCNRQTLERPGPEYTPVEWVCSRCHRTYTDAEYYIACREYGQLAV